MSRRYISRGGVPLCEITCNSCGDIAIEQRWWSPRHWVWPKVDSVRLDICPACQAHNSTTPNIEHRSKARRRTKTAIALTGIDPKERKETCH